MGDLSRELFRTANRVNIFWRGAGAKQLIGRGFTGKLGEGTNFTGRSDTGAQYVRVIGTPIPPASVDTAYSHSVTLSLVQLVSRAAADILNTDYVDIDVLDPYTNQTIKTFESCRVQSGDLTVPANNLITEAITFIALNVQIPAAA